MIDGIDDGYSSQGENWNTWGDGFDLFAEEELVAGVFVAVTGDTERDIVLLVEMVRGRGQFGILILFSLLQRKLVVGKE